MSKIFDLCLATIMDAHLVTSDNQFGFKQKPCDIDKLLFCMVSLSLTFFYSFIGNIMYLVG